MKFIQHNLKMIRSRFRNNGWVLAELFLVFIVLWFLCDSLGCLKYTFYRPLGYNIDHVYQLTTIMGGESRDTTLTRADKYWSVLQKLEQEPTVEAASLSYWSLPMSGSNSYTLLSVDTLVNQNIRIISTTSGYTRVFRMQEDPNLPFAEMPAGDRYLMLSEASVRYFQEKMPEFSLDTPLFDGAGDSSNPITQKGVIGNYRTYRYGNDARSMFHRLDENVVKENFSNQRAQIIFRVKEVADGVDYRERFVQEIAPRLDIDNLFIADAVPYAQQQLLFEILNGDTDKVKSQAIVVLFLLVNVFLALIGTFWFRTRRRRGEIALRLALGSSKKQLFNLLIGEGILLLSLVTLPAMLVCYNIGIAEFTIGRTALITTWPVKWGIIRFLLGSLGAWLLMTLMVIVGIWFPARQAMQIEPAEALHEE